MAKNNKEIFWANDISVLYTNKKYLNFIPTSEMSRIEQLNAVTRFCIYFLILACITQKSEIWIQAPVLIIVFTYVLFVAFESDNDGKMETIKSAKSTDSVETFLNSSHNNKNIILEAGQYDEQNKLVTDTYQSSKHDKSKKKRKMSQNKKYSFDNMTEYTKATCRKPTPANPFMNPTANDFGIEMPPQACNIDDEDIRDKVTTSFNQDLFMDVSDLFERQNSQRQFYAIPGSNYPDTIGFANWLYSPESTCKINQSKCGAFEDMRYNR